MFEIGKKGAADTSPRQDVSPSRTETGAPRPSTTGRDAAVIGPSIHIDGDVRGEEDLLIEGEVNGTVQLKNNSLTIGSQGKVRADVYAHIINVDGFLEGDLYGSERVHIRKSAQERGNVTSPRVSLEDGAKFRGSIEMDPQAVQNAAGNRAPAPKQAPPAPMKSAAPTAAVKPEAPAAIKTGL
jgi:cytoskeletal protein CcmA (bactofilin family)